LVVRWFTRWQKIAAGQIENKTRLIKKSLIFIRIIFAVLFNSELQGMPFYPIRTYALGRFLTGNEAYSSKPYLRPIHGMIKERSKGWIPPAWSTPSVAHLIEKN